MSLEEQFEDIEGLTIDSIGISEDDDVFVELSDGSAFSVGTDEDGELVFRRYAQVREGLH